MERRDYLLREIEKIGLILSAIRQKLFGGKHQLGINLVQQAKEAKAMLLLDINFDLDVFLNLDKVESEKYLSGFEGFDASNMDELAELMAQIGYMEESDQSKTYLEKALELYELSGLKSKTYSFERQSKISNIKNALEL